MTNEEAIKDFEQQNRLLLGIRTTGSQETYERNLMAIEALKSKWIPVSDRVPEDDRLVIVCTEWGYVYTDYYFEDKPDFWELAHIIAWQDLPRAYKKEESE